jgi:RNA polymerase sigma-54 factor
MSTKHILKQNQVLKQKLSHQNIQLFKMIEMSLLQFEQRVKEELDDNPALENLENMGSDLPSSLEKIIESEENSSESMDSDENFYLDNFKEKITSEIEQYQEKFKDNSESDGEERNLFISIQDNESFIDNLLNQVRYFDLSDIEFKIAEYIIGNLDQDGYLRRELGSIEDDLAFRNNIIVSSAKIKEIIELVQSLDPPGIGASNLQECLLLQLNRKKRSKVVSNAIRVIQDYIELYTKKQHEQIIKKLKITPEEYILIDQEIKHLNPRPVSQNESQDSIGKYILPDFLVFRNGNKLELELHSYNQPNLAISTEFADLLKKLKEEKKKSKSENDTQQYLTDKINKASIFISLVKERQETMIIIMNAIISIQKEHFLTGDESKLKPMGLKHIAAMTNFDISTVSRVTSSKYIQTEFGIFSLKFFFSEGILNEDGEEVSTRQIMKKLEEIVASENKDEPFSDESLTDELKKHGFKIARRTTAKYRENLNIPPKHIRKTNL